MSERARLTNLLAELEAEAKDREAKRPSGATLANPSFSALVERMAYLTALLRTDFFHGDKVTFLHYGQEKTGTVARYGNGIVHLEDGRWLHRASATLQLSQESSNV